MPLRAANCTAGDILVVCGYVAKASAMYLGCEVDSAIGKLPQRSAPSDYFTWRKRSH